MADLVVTVPKWFWSEWIAEGDAVGEPETGEEWGYSTCPRPPIEPGERLYIVAHGKLRGYAPVTRVVRAEHDGRNNTPRFEICRRAGAVAITIDEPIHGFRGWRRVWWPRDAERPFPEWRAP